MSAATSNFAANAWSRPSSTPNRGAARLDEIDLLVLDVRGAELRVLRGGEETLAVTGCCYVEVFVGPLYEGCALLPDVVEFMHDRGFVLGECSGGGHGYGDALFLRRRPRARRAISDYGATDGSEVPGVVRRRGGQRGAAGL